MAKRARKLDIQKLLKAGRGSGLGNEYKPWIVIQDVPSMGRSTRLKGIKTNRQHEFLSDMERNYFYYLEFCDEVKDIREQFPLLPLEETLEIADELNFEHPRNPQTGEYVVMTTDFLITKELDGEMQNIARTIKAKSELLNRRVVEKFKIESVYWQRRGIDWAIVTDEEIEKPIARNISYFLSYYDVSNLDIFKDMTTTERQDLVLEYMKRVVDTEKTIREVSSIYEKDMSMPKGTGIAIFKHLLAHKLISVDLASTIDIDKQMDIKLREKAINKELNIS